MSSPTKTADSKLNHVAGGPGAFLILLRGTRLRYKYYYILPKFQACNSSYIHCSSYTAKAEIADKKLYIMQPLKMINTKAKYKFQNNSRMNCQNNYKYKTTFSSCLCTATTNTMQIVIKNVIFCYSTYVQKTNKQKNPTNLTTLNKIKCWV